MRVGYCWLGNLGHQSHLILRRYTYLTQNKFYTSKCAVGHFGHQSHLFLGGGGLVTIPLWLFKIPYSHQSHLFLRRYTYLKPIYFYTSKCAVGHFGHQSHLFLGGGPCNDSIIVYKFAVVTIVTYFYAGTRI